MKKFGSILVALIFGIFCFLPMFLSLSKTQTAFAASSDFSEENLTNKVDIVSTVKSELDSNLSLSSYVKSNETPFDSETNSPMAGVSIEPLTDEYDQIESTYTVQSFSISSDKSIFMWIFFPDEYFFDLTITFSTQAGETIIWSYNFSELSELITSSIQYGWKLLEFCAADAIVSDGITNLEEETFVSMTFAYTNSLGALNEKSSNLNLSFYHVYMADSFGTKTSVVKSQNYSYYSLSSDFLSTFNNLYIGDSYSFGTFLSLFSYIYVAKYDLKQAKSTVWNYFESEIKITNGSNSDVVSQNSTYTFSSTGWYSINITLTEARAYETITPINYSKSIYVTSVSLGSFSDTSYKLEVGETLVVVFNLSSSFVLEGEVEFEVSDKSVATISYYNQGNTYYVSVTGQSDGDITITATASGGKGDGEVAQYSRTASVSVEGTSSSTFLKIILCLTIAAYLIGFAIYVIIAAVRAKKSKTN